MSALVGPGWEMPVRLALAKAEGVISMGMTMDVAFGARTDAARPVDVLQNCRRQTFNS